MKYQTLDHLPTNLKRKALELINQFIESQNKFYGPNQFIESQNKFYGPIRMLRVNHDGQNIDFMHPFQMNRCLCDICVNIDLDGRPITKESIIGFVSGLGLTGIKQIDVFTIKEIIEIII